MDALKGKYKKSALFQIKSHKRGWTLVGKIPVKGVWGNGSVVQALAVV